LRLFWGLLGAVRGIYQGLSGANRVIILFTSVRT
jgi:hypothetical protein